MHDVSDAAARPGAAARSLFAMVGPILRLAVPVMLARAGLLVMITVDTVMLGHAGTAELAYYAIATALQVPLLILGFGLLTATVVLTAQARGAGRLTECGTIWAWSTLVAVAVGLAGALVLSLGPPLLLLTGQDPAIAEGGGASLRMLALGLPGLSIYMASAMFLEGLGRPRAGLVVVVAGNLVNVALNWWLIDGGDGVSGSAGATLATSICRWLMCVALVGYVLGLHDRAALGIGRQLALSASVARRLLRLGTPLAAANGLESSAFATLAVFAGWLGAAPLAAWQITLNVLSIIYMLAVGIATATAVQVGMAVGRSDGSAMRLAGWTGAGLVGAIMSPLLVALLFAPETAVALYTDDPSLVPTALAAMSVAAWLVLVDGAQGVLMGALRGAADVLVPTFLHLVSFWVCTVPLAYVATFPLGHGMAGLLWSLFVGLAVASGLLAWRFHAISRRSTGDA